MADARGRGSPFGKSLHRRVFFALVVTVIETLREISANWKMGVRKLPSDAGLRDRSCMTKPSSDGSASRSCEQPAKFPLVNMIRVRNATIFDGGPSSRLAFGRAHRRKVRPGDEDHLARRKASSQKERARTTRTTRTARAAGRPGLTRMAGGRRQALGEAVRGG